MFLPVAQKMTFALRAALIRTVIEISVHPFLSEPAPASSQERILRSHPWSPARAGRRIYILWPAVRELRVD